MIRFAQPLLAAASVLLPPSVLSGQDRPAAPAPPVRVMLGQQVVDCASRTVVGELGLRGNRRGAEALGNGTWTLADHTVDPGVGQVLVLAADRVSLRTLEGKPIWSVDRVAASVHRVATAGQRWLADERVVLPSAEGGLVALDRATGAIAWQSAEMPVDHVLVDGGLVIAAGVVAGTPKLHVVALQNGARAFDCRIAGPVARIAAGPHGIAVVDLKEWRVYDRTGPLLFTGVGAPQDVVCGADGWFTLAGGNVGAWSRTGGAVWTVQVPKAADDEQRLVARADGSVVHIGHGASWDSGFVATCLDAQAGDTVWQATDPGLGVGHSKYWHCVQTRVAGDRLLVTSQAAGGCFLVELDARTGERRARAEFPIR